MSSLFELARNLVQKENFEKPVAKNAPEKVATPVAVDNFEALKKAMQGIELPHPEAILAKQEIAALNAPDKSLQTFEEIVKTSQQIEKVPISPEVTERAVLDKPEAIVSPAVVRPPNEVAPTLDNELVGGRELVGSFLSEVKDLLAAGKELEQLNADKNSATSKTEVELADAKNMQNEGTKISEALSAFLLANDRPEAISRLEEVQKSYKTYLDYMDKELQTLARNTNANIGKMQAAINAKRVAINNIVTSIGGNENFNQIKKFISLAEKIAVNYITRETGYVKKETRELISKNIKEFVTNDLHGAKLLVGSGDIMSVLMGVFQNLPKTDK